MPRKPEPLEPWMLEAINLMVRQNLTLRQAASQLGQDLSPQQCDNILGRVRFHDALEEAHLKHFTEIGSNPRLTKDAVVGQLFVLAQRLASDREDYKAADSLLKLAKVQGWINGEGGAQRDDFLKNIRQSDIDWMKAQLDAKEQQEQERQEAERSEGEGSEQKIAKVN
jgi:hypothetical protein